MTQNGIILFGMIEVLIFIIVIYLIIRADIFVNALQKEIADLNLCLSEIIRDIKYDLKAMNAELSENIMLKPPSPEKLGMIAGKIFSEIIMYRLTSLKFAKKYAILPVVLKTLTRPFKTKVIYKNIR